MHTRVCGGGISYFLAAFLSHLGTIYFSVDSQSKQSRIATPSPVDKNYWNNYQSSRVFVYATKLRRVNSKSDFFWNFPKRQISIAFKTYKNGAQILGNKLFIIEWQMGKCMSWIRKPIDRTLIMYFTIAGHMYIILHSLGAIGSAI